MSALQIVLALTAVVWLGSLVAVVACVVLDSRNDEAWEVERPVWADDPTPTYEALCFEFWEQEVRP